MKILSKLKLAFTPTDNDDAVTKGYVDNLVSNGGNSSTYYGSINMTSLNKINITISETDITTSTLLLLKSSSASISDASYTDFVQINSQNTTYKIVDKFGESMICSDIVNGGYILLGFDGDDFVFLSDSLGSLGRILDKINRKVV